MDKSKYFLDLSKCTEEEQIKAIAFLPEPINEDDYDITHIHLYLLYDDEDCMWWVSTKYFLADKTELTYPEFIKLFEGGEGEKTNEHTCKYCGCLTTQPDIECYAAPNNTMETPKNEPWIFCETPEEKCTMNYCDENGCQNRKRNLVKPKKSKAATFILGQIDKAIEKSNLEQQIEKLEAEKKELLALMVTMKDSFDNKDWVTSMELQSFSKRIESLIQKHKQ